MGPFDVPAAIGIAVGVAGVLLWWFSSDRTRIVPRMALGFGPVALAAGLTFALLALFSGPRPPAQATPPGLAGAPPLLPPGDYPTAPIARGEKAPPLEVEGWLNEPFSGWGAEGSRLTVVDIWAVWCPGCRATAPGLVNVYRKYKDRGVAFISLTNMPRHDVTQFTHEFMIPWPCAYGATDQTIARFGAFDHGVRLRGYEIKLALYLVGTDGRILWNDDHGRMKHQDPAVVLQRLENEIEKALAVPVPESRG